MLCFTLDDGDDDKQKKQLGNTHVELRKYY